jgi:hypothetical protein
MIACNEERATRLGLRFPSVLQVNHEVQASAGVGATVAVVAEEHDCRGVELAAQPCSQRIPQRFELGQVSMYVANAYQSRRHR